MGRLASNDVGRQLPIGTAPCHVLPQNGFTTSIHNLLVPVKKKRILFPLILFFLIFFR